MGKRTLLRRAVSLAITGILFFGLAVPGFAAEDSPTATAKKVLSYINADRKEQGLEALKWNDELAEAAQQRAKEIAENYSKYGTTHTRPDGSKYYSVSKYVWGENAAYGQDSAREAASSWIGSKGHHANILDDRFTITGVGYYEANGETYWIQLFGTGQSNEVWTKIDWAKKDAEQAAADAKKESEKKLAGLVNSDGKIVENAAVAVLQDALKKQDATATVTVRAKGAKSISPAALQALANTAGSRAVLFNADTMSSTGKTVAGRLTFNPTKLTGRTKDLKLEVTPGSDTLKNTIKEASALTNFVVVSTAQRGNFGASVQIAVKAKTAELDTSALKVYRYDSKTNNLTLVENAKCTVDKNSYLKFTTTEGGDFVITDQTIQ